MAFIKRLWLYLLSKVSEVKHMDYKDALAATVITEIQARKTSEESEMVPLYDLLYFHKIDRESAIEKKNKRAKTVEKHKNDLIKKKTLTKKWMVKHFPSITHFKAVPYGDKYVVYDGNGRLMAFKQVLKETDNVKVEVDVLTVPPDIARRIRQVRKMNKLE